MNIFIIIVLIVIVFFLYGYLWWRRLITQVEAKTRPLLEELRKRDNDFEQGEEYAARAHAAFARGDRESETRHSRRAAEHFGDAGQPFLAEPMVAKAQAREGRFLEAAQSLENALTLFPSYLPEELATEQRACLLSQQAGYYRQGGWHSHAYVIARQAVDAGAVRFLGSVALRQAAQLAAYNHDWQEAERFVAEATAESSIEDDRIDITETIVFVRHLQGRLTEALAINESLLQGENVPPKVYSASGDILQKLGRFDEAASRLEEALLRVGEQHPSLITPMGALYCIGLAQTRMLQSRYSEAQELLNAANGIYPPNHLLGAYLGGLSLLLESAMHSTASSAIQSKAQTLLNDIDERMKKIPSRGDALRFYFDTHLFLAQALIVSGDGDGCFSILERFAQEDVMPVSEPRYYYLRGQCHEKRSAFPDAIADYTRAVSTTCDPNEHHVIMARERLNNL